MDERRLTLSQVSDFFLYLFQRRQLVPGTIQGYRTVLAEFIPRSVVDIRGSEELDRLMKSFYRDRPRSSRSLVPWDLRVVLEVLSKPPFEPISKIALKRLSQKNVFLIALATGRRRGELRALARDRVKWHNTEGSVQLFPHPDFLSKNLKSTDPATAMRPIIIPSLERFVGQDLVVDSYNCPVRCLKEYIDRTDKTRGSKKLLFVSMIPTQSEISPNTISAWLKETISSAYEIQNNRTAMSVPVPSNIKAHQVRGLAASWAVKGNASISQIMDACFWKTQNTFTSFYLKDLWVDKDDYFSFGPFVAANAIIDPSAGGLQSAAKPRC